MNIKVTPNHQKRTFTIRRKNNGKTIGKYRTIKYCICEFEDMTLMTEKDWYFFLTNLTNEYYVIK